MPLTPRNRQLRSIVVGLYGWRVWWHLRRRPKAATHSLYKTGGGVHGQGLAPPNPPPPAAQPPPNRAGMTPQPAGMRWEPGAGGPGHGRWVQAKAGPGSIYEA